MNTRQAIEATALARTFEGVVDGETDETLIATNTVESDSPSGSSTTDLHVSHLRAAARLLREQSEGVSLDEHQRDAILRALRNMPYGGLVMHRLPLRSADRGEFVEQLVDALKAFAVELNKASVRDDARERELRVMQMQRDAVRSFLGIEQLSDDVATIQATSMQELRTIADAVTAEGEG